MAKVYVFLADGFEDIEALGTVDILRRGGQDVKTVSITDNEYVETAHGVTVKADLCFGDADFSDADMLVLPGGMPGAEHLNAHEGLRNALTAHAAAGRHIAAICAAPSVLASLGLLEGRNATAHAGFQDKLAGAIVHDEEVVVDGSITTSYGLGGAIPFALELVRQLAGPAEADRIQKAIAYRH